MTHFFQVGVCQHIDMTEMSKTKPAKNTPSLAASKPIEQDKVIRPSKKVELR